MVGMNPGPFGMAQTGVPFGDVAMVRDFLGITGRSEDPPRAPAAADRRASTAPLGGERHALWGWARDRVRYRRALLRPRLRRELVPARLHGRVRAEPHAGQAARGRARAALPGLRRRARTGRRRRSARRSSSASAASPSSAPGRLSARRRIGQIPHPSPASPAANRDWPGLVDAQLRALGFEPS